MTTERFTFQRAATKRALAELEGLIVNVGCKEDPAHLKAFDPERIVNCDHTETDNDYGTPIAVDRVFDCVHDEWPFKDGEAALVVLGDILEHLDPAEIRTALIEGRRVAKRLCITVPEDTWPTTAAWYADGYARGHKHRTVVTEELLRGTLEATGWTVTHWAAVDYGLWPVGYFVEAK